MTLPVWQGLAAREENSDIVVLASPTVTVTNQATGGQPNLFSDRDGNTGIGNPFTANADGSIEFYVSPGRYKVEATKGGETVTWDNQLIGTVHGAEHLWKLATTGIVTVAGNASSPVDDAYSADLGGNLSDGDTFFGRIANRNETTTPTFENTGGTPGALTITAYDGRPLWPGALEGDHRFQYEAGTSPETWVVHDPNEMGVVDPEHATDGSSPTNDEYVSARNTDPPGPGVEIRRDFRTANETTTPTLDSLTITTRGGSALWANALSGPHTLQLASDSGSWLVLDPNPIDEDDMASDSDAAVPTQQSVKAYALTGPGTSSDPSLAFDTWRTPNADRATFVEVRIRVETDGTDDGRVEAQVDEDGGTSADYFLAQIVDNALGSGFIVNSFSFLVPAGASYQIRNLDDPTGNNAIQNHQEFTL